MDRTDTSWKTKTYLIGALIGLALGLVAAFFYTRAAQENNHGQKPGAIQTGDAVRLALSALGIVRQIAEMGASSVRKP